MTALDLQHGGDLSISEFSLSSGFGPWIDDVIATGAVVLIVSLLASRTYRWARAQADRPRDLVDTMVRQAKEAGNAAVQGWRGGNGHQDATASGQKESDLALDAPLVSPPGA